MKKTVSVLLKPAADRCNMRCTYCFYTHEAENRKKTPCGFMSVQTMRTAVRKVLEYADGGDVYLVFQGGEPLLVGLPFYEEVLRAVKKYNRLCSRVFYSLQTNGVGLTPAFASFFAKNGFLLGVSLDGTAEIHNTYRRAVNGDATFESVMRGISLLREYRVEFNILTVVTNAVAEAIDTIYAFYREQGFNFLQFIPFIPPMRGGGPIPEILSVEKYTAFLLRVFELWQAEIESGHYRSVAHLDQIGSFLLGYPYTSCSTRGVCANQLVIEADGTVYPCDFFAGDVHCIGNILINEMAVLTANRLEQLWREDMQEQRESCKSCPYFAVCRGGCARYFTNGQHMYCESLKTFYSEKLKDFQSTVRKIRL